MKRNEIGNDVFKRFLAQGVSGVAEKLRNLNAHKFRHFQREKVITATKKLQEGTFKIDGGLSGDDVTLGDLLEQCRAHFQKHNASGLEEAALMLIVHVGAAQMLHPVRGYADAPTSNEELDDRLSKYGMALWMASQVHALIMFDGMGHLENAARAIKANADRAAAIKRPKSSANPSRNLARQLHEKHPTWSRTRIAQAVAEENKRLGRKGTNATSMLKTLKSTFDAMGLRGKK